MLQDNSSHLTVLVIQTVVSPVRKMHLSTLGYLNVPASFIVRSRFCTECSCALFVIKFWRSTGDIKVQKTLKLTCLKIWKDIWSGIRNKEKIRSS